MADPGTFQILHIRGGDLIQRRVAAGTPVTTDRKPILIRGFLQARLRLSRGEPGREQDQNQRQDRRTSQDRVDTHTNTPPDTEKSKLPGPQFIPLRPSLSTAWPT